MLYIFYGRDDFSLVQALEELKKEVAVQDALIASITTLDGQQLSLSQLRTVGETAFLFAARHLVIIKGLLERYEPRGKSRRKTTRINHEDEHQSFASGLSQIPESTIVVLVETTLARNNPLFRQLVPKAVVKTFPLLRDDRLRQWIGQRVTEEGGSMSPRAVELLAKLVGGNLWVMASELSKLVLFTSGRRIEEGDVMAVVSYAQEANVFAMVDAILGFKAEVAEQLLQQLLQKGATPAYLLVMLARQLEMIVRVRELRRQGKERAEIQQKLELTSDFVLNKALEQASRYSLARLQQMYHRLLETDLSIKTGKLNAELALNILVAELCQPGKIPARRPRAVLN